MPDWSYRPLIRPALFALPAAWAQGFALGFLNWLTWLPGGRLLIDLMGHMKPPRGIDVRIGSDSWASPIGVGSIVDPAGRARRGFSRFGLGWIGIGPVGVDGGEGSLRVDRDVRAEALVKPERGRAGLSLAAARRMNVRPSAATRIVFEMTSTAREFEAFQGELLTVIEALADRAAALVISPEVFDRWAEAKDDERRTCLARLARKARDLGSPLLLGLPLIYPGDRAGRVLEDARQAGIDGVYLGGRWTETGMRWSAADAPAAIEALTTLRERWGRAAILAIDAGLQSPRQALEMADAGADLLAVSTGLVFSGPGLPKRCNEALLCARGTTFAPADDPRPAERTSWFWTVILGSGMLIGATLAAWIALTSVLMPYDEAYLGRSREALAAFNPRILQFMTHDRITLAGTMASVAVLYFAFGYFGVRRGFHWAQRAVVYSALFGFLTFFAFLGFGYLDPFHAFVSAILFQLFLMILITPLPQRRAPETRDLDNDSTWSRCLWGQLLFVVQSVGLLLAGTAITAIGMTGVFVREDIGFLKMSPETIASFDPQLVPIIAHDRATFGGMLIASGIVLLLGTLWGFRRGDRWQWWAYLFAATPPYAATIWIHHDIGYVNHFHLSPVYIGVGLLLLALVLSRRFLWDRAPDRNGPG